MSRFGDPGYRNHARTAQLTAILALRLANAEVLPYDVVGLAGRLDSLWSPLGRMATAQAGSKEEDLAPLDRALEEDDDITIPPIALTLHPGLSGRLLPVLSNIIVTRPLTDAERDSIGWKTALKISDTRRLLYYYRLLPDQRVLFGARGGIHDTPARNRRQRDWLQRRFVASLPHAR